MSAIISEDGPDRGTTSMPLLWHRATSRHQSDVALLEQVPEHFHLLLRGMLVEFVELEFGDASFQPCSGQETPRRPGLFHDISLQLMYNIENGSRKDFPGVVVSQRGWDKI